MPTKTAPKTTSAKKSSSSPVKQAQAKSSKPASTTSKPKTEQKSSGLLTPLLIVCIVFAGFIGYYIADQRAIVELHKVISQCQQVYKY
jgi:hypothetical protein